MLQLRVHRFSVPLIRAYHDTIPLQITRSSSLYPLLTSSPSLVKNTSLQAVIDITGPSKILSSIHREAGHTIYRAHTDQLMTWMYCHLLRGQEVYSSMVAFYHLFDITPDDLPYDTAYKIWQRWIVKKNARKPLHISHSTVLRNATPLGDHRDDVLKYLAGSFQDFALDALHHHPLPSDSTVRRYLMRTLHSAGWTHLAIGEAFGCTRQRITYCLSRH